MGQNVNADIFYGFVFEEGFPNFDLYEAVEEWNEQFAPKQPPDTGKYDGPEWDAWRKKNEAWEETGPGLIEGTAGHLDGYCRNWVGLMGHSLSASWDPKKIPDNLMRDPSLAEVKVLNDFLEKYMVGKQEIGWYLAPHYGH